jgi:NodT family efflux transporter outer membrane factor (OMF) lipoprotein
VVRRRLAAAAALVAASLGACTTVGPNYKLPAQAVVNAPAAKAGFRGAVGGEVVSAPPPDHWWRLYDDPRLDALVEQALANNTDLRVAEANLERSQSLVEAAKAARQPDFVVGLGTSETQRSAEAYVHPGAIPVRGLYDAGVAVSYDLDLFGRLRRGVEAASADAEAAQAARDLARVNVAAETVRAYAEVCDTGAELAAAERMLQVQAEGAQLVQRMATGGRDITVSVARQDELVDQIRATMPALRARQSRALFRLATLEGRPAGEFDQSLAACREPPRMRAPLPVGDGAGLLRRRPDVRAAERRLAAATARIGVETAALYPTVQLGGSIGSTGALQDFASGLTRRYSIGPTMSWHANLNVPRARIAAAGAAAKAELARFDGAVLGALQETETALDVYAQDLDRQADLESRRAHAEKLAQAAHDLQRGGRAGALTVLDADRTVVAADQALAANRSQITQDQIAVFLALGGGWQQ